MRSRELRLAIKKPQVWYCSWCHASLQPGQKAWHILTGSKFDFYLGGQWIELEILELNKIILVFILGENSREKREGWKIMFLACSPGCREKLEALL